MRIEFALGLCLPLLAGCSFTPAAAPPSENGLGIHGVVHGGQQPITGAHIYVFAAAASAYESVASPVPSNSLLNSNVILNNPLNFGQDLNNNYYVTTDANGSFTITNDYTCTLGQQVYLYAIGGNPGLTAGTNNTAAGLLAILGDCPVAGTFAPTVSFVFMDEVSTVAAAYAFAGFALDATHVSYGGSALGKTGITNAFANAANLAGLSTGLALATTPAANGGNGTVPQQEINTLANILAACINTSDSSSAGCSTLFSNIKSGGATGTTATDTATAAIYLAQNPHPGDAQMTALYGNPTPATPFSPPLSAQPNDFTIALNFTGGGVHIISGIAIDSSGDVWVTNNIGTGTLSEFAPNGRAITGSVGYLGGGLSNPNGLAIDQSGNVWVSNYGSTSVSEFTAGGTAISGVNGYTGGGLNQPWAIAIDGSGNAWLANKQGNSLSKFDSSGNPLSGSTGYPDNGGETPQAIAIDGAGDA